MIKYFNSQKGDVLELVYLWVEDYKNIKKQGFNFSPRFHCAYDEKSNELTIDENDDYIPDFFGENINVTAIVGKNGSGKSSVLKLLMMLIFYKSYYENERGEISSINRLNVHKFYNIFCLIKTVYGLKKISIKDTIQSCFYNKKTISLHPLANNKLDFFTMHFNYMIDSLYHEDSDEWVNSIYHKSDSYKTPLLLEPYKNYDNKKLINLEIINYLNNQNMLTFYFLFDNNKKLVDFFNPNKVHLTKGKVIAEFLEKNGDEFEFIKDETYKLIGKYIKLIIEYKIHKNDSIFLIQAQIEELYNQNKYQDINTIYVAFKILSSSRKLFKKDIYDKLIIWIEDEICNELVPIKILIENNQFKDIFNDKIEFADYEIKKIKSCINFRKEGVAENPIFIKHVNMQFQGKSNLKELKSILKFIPPWIDTEWFEDDKSINSLSSGEKVFFTFIINLMYQIQNIQDISQYSTLNIFLDEVELGFHPQWQKEYIKRILRAVEVVNLNNKQINFIFASHSPFLLSDIPKQNIIFLDKDEKGNCKVVDGLKEKKQTFGANIHTLLSDSFFMEDGLMGEFAKSKIDRAIKLLNQEQLNEDELKYCEQIISIIGEPIVKNQLQRMLDSKRLKKVDEIDAIKKSMIAMKQRLDELEK